MITLALPGLLVGGCKTPGQWRQQADDVAYANVEDAQKQALGRTEPFWVETAGDTLRRRLLLNQDLPFSALASLSAKDIEKIEQWPEDDYLDRPDTVSPPPWEGDETVILTLSDALMVGARNSREYQTQKEFVFQTALDLDLERNFFRTQWFGLISGAASADLGSDVKGVEGNAALDILKRFENGAELTTRLTVDIVKLLSMDKDSAYGLLGDASISIPLLRGSGKFVVTEPLTQAQRDVVYAIYDFERFKRVFAVDIATSYYSVLQSLDAVDNAEQNYRRLIGSTRRASRMAVAGRLPEIQVDQSRQDELRARNRWILAVQSYERNLDRFKLLLGLPTDARIALEYFELEMLATNAESALHLEQTPDVDESLTEESPIEQLRPSLETAGPLEMDPDRAIKLALANRLDLRRSVGQVYDAQRVVAVAADGLRAELTLFGSATVGESRTLSSAGVGDADFRFDEGSYSALLTLDLPLERTAERNTYRSSLINLEQAARDVQRIEDTVKFEIRDDLRVLESSRETVRIQAVSVRLAQRRVLSTNLFLQAGRAEIRDVLEAQESLLEAQDAFTDALVNYRLAELQLQRDLGLLTVDEQGLWTEFVPGNQARVAPATEEGGA